jgi:hypothetical protein
MGGLARFCKRNLQALFGLDAERRGKFWIFVYDEGLYELPSGDGRGPLFLAQRDELPENL